MTTSDSLRREKPITVVVTAVGAIIGQGIVASLRKSGLAARIIGVDRDPDGIGRYWCDTFHPKPTCDEDSPEYIAFWAELLAREQVDLVLPGLELDVLFFSRHRRSFEGLPTRLALNEAGLIEVAQDKWDFGLRLREQGLAAIPACLDCDWSQCVAELGPPPLILKPRRGNGSRGIAVLRDEVDFDYWSARSKDAFLIQKYVGSDDAEYTVGAFGLGGGRMLPPIIFRRKLSVAGNTQYAEVVANAVLSEAVARLAAVFKPLGPTNYQFRLDGDTPHLLEINPRFSSSTSLRAAFGYNEALMSVDFYLRGTMPEPPVVTSGRGWRYYEDLVVG